MKKTIYLAAFVCSLFVTSQAEAAPSESVKTAALSKGNHVAGKAAATPSKVKAIAQFTTCGNDHFIFYETQEDLNNAIDYWLTVDCDL